MNITFILVDEEYDPINPELFKPGVAIPVKMGDAVLIPNSDEPMLQLTLIYKHSKAELLRKVYPDEDS